VVTRYPELDQALELFLDKAGIDPDSETGRISIYVLEHPNMGHLADSDVDAEDLQEMALMQIAGFRDAKAIQRVVAETFPPEGSLKLSGREYPLFVVMDINQAKIRLLSDDGGRLWIGGLAVFQEVAKRQAAGDMASIYRAAEWVSASGTMQGFVRPELLPKEAVEDFADLGINGIHGLAWSVSPMEKDGRAIALDLAITGDADAISRLKPWMQRVIAMTSSLAGDGARRPETIQEKNRMGIRCQFNEEQLGRTLNMLHLDEVIPFADGAGVSKPGRPE
jgi:hypothetical protein